MTRRDGNHKVAEIIKRHEKRLANLEEKDRSSGTPNLLRKVTDRVTVDDGAITVTKHTLETATWSSGPNETGGWHTTTWGSYE